ncbi:MAG: YggS family pyridoxal phosphate-dependent enzyme, partial [Syntrophales bacterium]
MESTVKANIEIIRAAIARAALRVGRNVSDVRLMAVTKTVDDDRIMEAIEAGVDIIGESYVQEAKRKIEKMGRTLEWHMIGYLQSN